MHSGNASFRRRGAGANKKSDISSHQHVEEPEFEYNSTQVLGGGTHHSTNIHSSNSTNHHCNHHHGRSSSTISEKCEGNVNLKIRKRRRIRVSTNGANTLAWYAYACLTIVGLLLMVVGHVQRQRNAASNMNDDADFVDVGQHEQDLLIRRVNPQFKASSNHKEEEKVHKDGDPNNAQTNNPHLEKKAKVFSTDKIGDKSPHFQTIWQEFKTMYPQDDVNDQLRLEWVKTVRANEYVPIDVSPGRAFDNDLDCPDEPPSSVNYPRAYSTLEIINHWNPDTVTPPSDGAIYQGICVFHYDKPGDLQKAQLYREAEVPFVMRDDPAVLRSVQRWNHPEYLTKVMADEPHHADFSHSNHFMFWLQSKNRKIAKQNRENGWKPPTETITMTYPEWLSKANSTEISSDIESDHWYFRLIGCGEFKGCDKFVSEWIFDDLEFFFPRESLYIVKPAAQKGIHCRLGMKGVIAENHFDMSRNFIVVLGGERRYILSHPEECPNLALYPKEHPSARHSAVDWSDPDLQQFPQFTKAKSNEIVLQAGDVLYLPTNWFHYIMSLGLNYQCNTRSGTTEHYMPPIEQCGFAPP
jgi:hypothetical protein